MATLTIKDHLVNVTGIRRAILMTLCICLFSLYGAAQNVGIGTTAPASKVDVSGDLALREGAPLTVAAGANALTLPTAKNSVYRLTGASGAFSISSISGGNDGMLLTLINATGKVMTITNGTIQTNTGADLVAASTVSSVCLIYNATMAKWLVVSGEGFNTSAATAWSTTGNSGTTPGTNFIGTTDTADLMLKVNGQQAGIIENKNNNNSTALGYQALVHETPGIGLWSVAIGYQALYSQTNDGGNGGNNTAIGYQGLYANTSGENNTALGTQALKANTSGTANTANGAFTLLYNTTGTYNTANGTWALSNNTSGSNNAAVGTGALNDNTTGNNNVSIGQSALYSSTTSNGNTAVGNAAMYASTTGGYNSAFGDSAAMAANNLTNATAIGAHAYVSASNSLVLGSINGVNGATASVNVGIGTTAPLNTLTVQQSSTFATATATDYALAINSSSGTQDLTLGSDTSYAYIQSWQNKALVINTLGNNTLVPNGYVGIGTNDPAARLHVLSSYFLTAILESSSTEGTWLGLHNTSTGGQWFQVINTGSGNSQGAGKLLFATGNTYHSAGYDFITLDWNSDNTGIGTSSPAYTLDVAGQGRMTASGGGSGSALIVNGSTGAAASWDVSGNGTDQKWWDLFASGTTLQGRAVNDANSAATNWLQVSRGSGYTVSSVTFPNGNVGIGTTSPFSLLSNTAINILGADGNGISSPSLAWAMSTNGYTGALYNGSTLSNAMGLAVKIAGTASTNKLLDLSTGTSQAATGTTVMAVFGNGNVGIGTSSPSYTLDVAGQGRMTASGGGSGSALIVNGSTGAAASWDVSGNGTDQKWWDLFASGTTLQGRAVNDANSAATNWLQVSRGSGYTVSSVTFPNGNVGIGTNSPGAPLDVSGYESLNTSSISHSNVFNGNTYTGFTYLETNGSTSNTGFISSDGAYGISVRASAGVLAQFFIAPSDARIKNIIGTSCNAEDLETLNKIKVTDYTMRDKKVAGNSIFKKVIAQQLKEVYPQAVKSAPLAQFIPDIYQKAESYTIQGNQLTVHMSAMLTDTNIRVGSMCKFYLYDKDGKEKEMKGSITAFGGKQMQISISDTLNPDKLSSLLFVYGVEINDLLTVDYEAISMLNVSATQELARKLKASEQTIQELTDQNQKLEKALNAKADASDIQQLKAEIESLKAAMLSSAGM